MKLLKVFLLVSLLALITAGLAFAQNPAYQTSFITSVTYQNVSSNKATVTFNFYQEGSGTPIPVTTELAGNAGTSLFIGGLNQIPSNFSGSAVLSSDQPIVATLVQLPQSSTVKARPLSNGFSSASSTVILATALKNRNNTTTKFSIQNASSGAIDLTVKFYNADNTSAAPVVLNASSVPAGSAKSYDLGALSQLSDGFNGSVIVTAVAAGTNTPANIVGSALELSTNATEAKAFEGVASGAKKVYMPSALCKFGGFVTTTFYAVQNADQSTDTSVKVTYSNGKTDTKPVAKGAKTSFDSCSVNDAGFLGAAIIESTATDIVVVGKSVGDKAAAGISRISTAFLGESQGSAKLALPYVRWTPDAKFTSGERQRTFIAIQNVGSALNAGDVKVKYLNKNGDLIGTHTLGAMANGGKLNSTAADATLAAGRQQSELDNFGNPEGNPGGGSGGAVIIEGPSGSQLVAIARVQNVLSDASRAAEDYNGIPIQ